MKTSFSFPWRLIVTVAVALLAQEPTRSSADDGPPHQAVPSASPSVSPSVAETHREEVRANIELWESRVLKRMQQVDQILNGMDLRKIEGQKIAAAEIDGLLADLDEEAQELILAHSQIGSDLKLYHQALLQAPEIFNKAAAAMDARAAEKKSGFLKEAYADMGVEARALATAYQQKAKDVEMLSGEIVKKMEFVHESRIFISDVRGLLAAIPTNHGLKTEQLVQRLNRYIEVFQEAVKAIKGVSGKISERPQPTPTEPPSARPTPTAAASLPPAATVDEFRQRLAAAKR